MHHSSVGLGSSALTFNPLTRYTNGKVKSTQLDETIASHITPDVYRLLALCTE